MKRLTLAFCAVLCVLLVPATGARAALSNTADAGVPAANGPVFAVALGPDRVYIGGQFTMVGGQPRQNIAAIDRTTGALDPTFNPGANARIFTLKTLGSTVYAGGEFTSIGGQSRQMLAALDGATGVPLPTFNPTVTGRPFSLATRGSTVYVGGQITMINGQPRAGIAALDAVTAAVDLTFNPGSGNTYALSVLGPSALFAGGQFSTFGGSPRTNVARVDGTTGIADPFVATPNSQVFGFAPSGASMFVAGFFNMFNGQSRQGIVRVNATTGALETGFNPLSDGAVLAASRLGQSVIVRGCFSSIGGQPRTGLAELNANSGVASAWNPAVAGDCDFSSVVVDEGVGGGVARVYIGCPCLSVGGQSGGFARFTEPTFVTAVTWRRGGARSLRGGRGNLVWWRTGQVTDIVGFDVIRRRAGQRPRTINRELIDAVGNRRGSYRVRDRRGRESDRYTVRATDLDGTTTAHRIG